MPSPDSTARRQLIWHLFGFHNQRSPGWHDETMGELLETHDELHDTGQWSEQHERDAWPRKGERGD